MAEKDLYAILGLPKNASDADIKSAYRKLAKKYHPDLYASAPASEKAAAEAKFKEINVAYGILSDPQKKAYYDRYGTDNPQHAGGGGFSGFGSEFSAGGFEDIINNIFSSFAGGRASHVDRANARIDGDDITIKLSIDLKEAAFGCDKEITVKRVEKCSDCKGMGTKNAGGMKTCPKCGGTGEKRTVQNSIFGQIVNTTVCDECHGRGKIITDPCKTCGGRGEIVKSRIVKVSVPAGVDSGQSMTYYNEGNAGKNGGANGNLIILLDVKPHPKFKRKGGDLFVEVPITFSQAALGCKVEAPTLSDKVVYVVPEATQSGTVFRLKGKGIKLLRKDTYGDLYVTIIVETPKGLNREQKNILEKLENITSASNYPKSKKN